MTIRLSLRKRFRKLIADSKGFSSVIGTTFMVLVMMFLSTGVFLWTLSQNTTYNEAVKARNQEEADRRNENVITLGGNYSVSGNQVTLKVILKNDGSLAAQVVNLWILDTNQSRYANKSLNLNLNPGDSVNFLGSSLLTVTIPDTDAAHTFASWFVTARGNTFSIGREAGDILVAQVAQGIGYLAMDFDNFKYFEYESDYDLKDFPTGSGGYNVPAAEHVVFAVELTNYDPSGLKRSLTLNSHSLIWMYFPTQGKQLFWHVVNVDVNGTIEATYSEITLAYEQTVAIYFASRSDGSYAGTPDKVKPGTIGPAAINLVLLGTIGSNEYGQNIPFVSVYCS